MRKAQPESIFALLSFCPMCGRPLTKEAQEDLKSRIKG